MTEMFKLNEQDLRSIDERMEALKEEGVKAYAAPSEELNISGCHRGYCQAWD